MRKMRKVGALFLAAALAMTSILSLAEEEAPAETAAYEEWAEACSEVTEDYAPDTEAFTDVREEDREDFDAYEDEISEEAFQEPESEYEDFFREEETETQTETEPETETETETEAWDGLFDSEHPERGGTLRIGIADGRTVTVEIPENAFKEAVTLAAEVRTVSEEDFQNGCADADLLKSVRSAVYAYREEGKDRIYDYLILDFCFLNANYEKEEPAGTISVIFDAYQNPVDLGAGTANLSETETNLYRISPFDKTAETVRADLDLSGSQSLSSLTFQADTFYSPYVLMMIEPQKEEETEEETEPVADAEDETEEETEPVADAEDETEEDTEPVVEGERVYTAGDGGVLVSVTAPAKALPEDAILQLILYSENSQAYAEAADAIGVKPGASETVAAQTVEREGTSFFDTLYNILKKDKGEEESGQSPVKMQRGLAVMDIRFLSDGEEVEPTKPVSVTIDASAVIPDDADPGSIQMQHLVEGEGGAVTPVVVAAEAEVAEFEVESFSAFTVTWSSSRYEFTLTVNTYDEETGQLMDTNVDGVDMSRSSGEEFDLTALAVDGYNFDYANAVYNGTTYNNATKISATIGSSSGSRYTVAIDYEGGTYQNSSSSVNEISVNAYFIPNPSVTIHSEGNDQQGYQLTAQSAHFGGDPELIWEDSQSGEGIAVIEETDEGLAVSWAEENGEVVAQVGDTVTIKVTAMYTDGDGTTQRATDSCVLTYGAVAITIRPYYTNRQTSVYPEGADVTLLDANGYILATGVTDENGSVTFYVIPGTYEAEAIYVDSSAYMGDTVIEVTAEGENSFSLEMTSAGDTVGHIDIGILATATLYINGKELTQEISINEFDFESENLIFQYSYSADGSSGYYDARGFMDLSSTEESTGTDSDGNTVNQIRIDGTYPVGTSSRPVYYYLSLTKDIVFTDGDTGQSYSVTMTFTSNFYYWDSNNQCPPLQNNTTWNSGGVVQGSGMDFVMTAATSDALVNVEKFVVDTEGNLMDAGGEEFSFELYLDHNYDSTDPHDEMEEYDDFSLITSNSGLGYYQGFVEVGHYFVVETAWPEQINGKNYLYTVVNIAYVSGEETGQQGEAQTGSSIVSGEAVADADNTPIFIFNNVYGEEEPTKDVDADEDGAYGDDGMEIRIGDELRYEIAYQNGYREAATVTITDVLDEGLDFVEASDGGSYDEGSRTITWVLADVAAQTEGSVTFTATVNQNALVRNEVENTASVQVGDHAAADTNTVVNPVGPDDPQDPEKDVDADADGAYGDDGMEVKVGDSLTYEISYYNHYNTSAAVTITDVLDEGLDFVEASDGGNYDEDTRTITWVIEDAAAYTEGSVTFTATVNRDALVKNEVENTASVQIGDSAAADTDTVVNPIGPDDPQDPEKDVDADADGAYGDDGMEVKIGDSLTYEISYYNHYNTSAIVTITDVLDEGLDFAEASDNGSYDEETRTITWVLVDAAAYTEGSVSFTATVNENARKNGKITNTASVQIGSDEEKETNEVENKLKEFFPIDEEIVPDESDRDSWVKEEAVNEYNAIEIEMSTFLPVIMPEDVANGAYTLYFHEVLDHELKLDEADADFSVYIAGIKISDDYYEITINPDDGCSFHVDVDLTALYNGGIVTDEMLQSADTEIMIFFYADLEGTGLNGSYTSSVWYEVYNGDQLEYTSNVDVIEVYTYEIEILKYDASTLSGTDYAASALAGAVLGISYDADGSEPVIRSGQPYTVASGDDGRAVFYGLADGTYYVRETEAPNGYVCSEEALEVTLDGSLNDSAHCWEGVFANTPVEEETETGTETGRSEPEPEKPRSPKKSVDVGDGTKVTAGEELLYTICYYNHHDEAVDVMISDELDDAVIFVDASDGGAYNAETHSVIWVIENAPGRSEGYVTLTVEVTDEAVGQVINEAVVQIDGDEPENTNPVENPIPDKDTGIPAKPVSGNPKAGNTGGGNGGSASGVKTGDTTPIGAVAGLAAAALAVLAGGLVFRRRRVK